MRLPVSPSVGAGVGGTVGAAVGAGVGMAVVESTGEGIGMMVVVPGRRWMFDRVCAGHEVSRKIGTEARATVQSWAPLVRGWWLAG